MSAPAKKGKKRTLSKTQYESLGLGSEFEPQEDGMRSGYASSVGYRSDAFSVFDDDDEGYETPTFGGIFSQDSQDDGLLVSPTGDFYLEKNVSYSPPEKKTKTTPPESPEKEGSLNQIPEAKENENEKEKKDNEGESVVVSASASASSVPPSSANTKTLSPQKPKKGGKRKRRRKTKKKRKSRKKKKKRKTKKKRRRRRKK